jgi:dTDP-4-dehydrorhamnose 3,5-epimerase-like enzyme
MAYLINLSTFSDIRGNLTVIEKEVPFDIKRVFYIYGVDKSIRGKHRHHKTIQAAICIKGSCIISNDDGIKVENFNLNSPEKCLLIKPEDYHWMHGFSKDAILLVLASEKFNPEDYIYQPYRENLFNN